MNDPTFIDDTVDQCDPQNAIHYADTQSLCNTQPCGGDRQIDPLFVPDLQPPAVATVTASRSGCSSGPHVALREIT